MDIKSKKSFALVFAIMFVLVCLLTSAAVYIFAFQALNEVQKHSGRGYYISLAGLRYASLLLQNPANAPINFNGNGHSGFDGETITLDIKNNIDAGIVQFKADIGLRNSETLTITITEYSTGNTQGIPPGCYQVTANFNS